MDPNAEVLDISSDEETGGGDDEPEIEDYDWISELLSGDSDDVVVVGEATPKLKLKSSIVLKSSVVDDDADDDDCVILDEDPDKPVSVVDDDAENRSDELLVVGEKGQIACRDYPHSRHLCAKFPFGTTPHGTHCDQCHCYVCDSLAPCVYWGTGSSIVDHCHATDKDGTWKLERKNVKLEKSGSPPVPKFPHTSLYMNQVPPPAHYNSLPRHPVSRPTVIRPCSSSTNFGVPNIISQSRSQRAGPVFPKNRLASCIVSPKLLGVRRSDRFQNVGSIGHKFVPTPSVFKRTGSAGGSFSVNQPYNPLYDVNLAYAPQQYSRNFTPLAIPIDKNLSRWQDSLSSVNLQPNLSGIIENSLPSQPAVYSQPASQPKDSQNIYQHGNQTPYTTDSSFPDIGISLVDNTSQSNQQSQAENTQLQSADPTEDPSLVPDFNAQIPGSEANLNPLFFDFEDWLMENQSFPGVSQTAVPSDPNILSTESSHIDTSLLYFDFETSLNGLTRA